MTIATEQLQSARDIFDAINAEDGGTRESLLLRHTANDPALRALVTRMLEADAGEQPLLDSPLTLAAVIEDESFLQPEKNVGRYRIVREIGSGGMGTVYLAELAEGVAEQFFAIKIVRSFSRDIVRRFQREQGILSRLQHPNIARFLDSGATATGNPYFVMDFVEGLPIHSFCEDRSLPIEDRLRLFRQLCAAIRYLHQNLVIHRDLKPGNILVTADGTVKLLDFGIARLLAPESAAPSATQTLAGGMTPDYASPEQVRGAVTSTLTDVYSLGILLYEILTGAKPFLAPDAPLHEVLRRICEDEPDKPSTTDRKLRGEIDNIVLKAIRKEPSRRYVSVEQFDDDVRRYLEGMPVAAQGNSFLYLARKFANRNRTGVIASAAALTLLCGGIVITSMEARVALQERTKAEVQTRRAQEQTRIADQRAEEAQRERQNAIRERENAERRLAELQKLAQSAVRAYNSPGAADPLAENARDSLAALQRESVLDPRLAGLLDTMSADLHGNALATNATWRVPKGWQAYAATEHEYRVGIDREFVHQGQASLFIRSLVDQPTSPAIVMQSFSAANYTGRRIRVTAFLRGSKVSRAELWVQTLGRETTSQADASAALSGTVSWRKYQVVVDVGPDTRFIALGVRLIGIGTLWADDFSFEQVPVSVPLTIQRGPANLGFTQ